MLELSLKQKYQIRGGIQFLFVPQLMVVPANFTNCLLLFVPPVPTVKRMGSLQTKHTLLTKDLHRFFLF